MLETSYLIGLLFLLVFAGVPICFVFATVSIVGVLMVSGNPLITIPQGIFGGIKSFTLLAIPFFILAGELMNAGGITGRLVKLSSLLVGRMKGGLAQINIVSSMFFGGITGSSVADTSAIGGILIPAMVKEGYRADFSVAVTATSSVVGPIIPPSIVMVVYGATMNTSIGALFLGGVIPGILIGFSLMVVVMLMARKNEFPKRTERYTSKEIVRIMTDAIIPLGMPLIIMGGILSGIFTPTEAGAISAFYAFIIGMFITKGKILYILPELIFKTAKTTASVLLILGIATVLSRIFAILRIQQALGSFIATNITDKILFLVFVNILLIFMGMFMEGNATIILMGPILAPIAIMYGIHPIQFGLIMCMNAVIGNATPPVGFCLFVGSTIGKVPLVQVAKKAIPFVFAEIVVLLLVTFIPVLTTWLPRMSGMIK